MNKDDFYSPGCDIITSIKKMYEEMQENEKQSRELNKQIKSLRKSMSKQYEIDIAELKSIVEKLETMTNFLTELSSRLDEEGKDRVKELLEFVSMLSDLVDCCTEK